MSLTHLKFIPLGVVLLLWIVYRKNQPKWYTILGIALALSGLTECTARIFVQREMGNHVVYNIFVMANICISLWLINGISPFKNIVRFGLIASVLLLFAYHLIAGGGIHELDSAAAIISGFCIGGVSAWALYKVAESAQLPLVKKGEFWILTAYLCYYICIAPIIGLVIYVNDSSQSLAVDLMRANSVLFIIHFVLIGIGILVLRHKPKIKVYG